MADRGGLSDQEVRARVTRLDDLLGRLEKLAGPEARIAMEAIEALTEVYGTALARVSAMAEAGAVSQRALAADEVIGHLLLLHGLHPDPAEQRIARALAEVAEHLGEDGDAKLTGIRDGVAAIRITASGCGSTTASLASSVRDVVLAAAPELAGVDPVISKPPALIPVETLLRRPAPS